MAMDPTYITAFVSSIQNVFSTMLQLPVTVGDPSIKKVAKPTHDVSGVIAMSGEVMGSIVLSFEQDAAESIVALFCGEKLAMDTADFADAVGELVNMVSGNAKAKFPNNKKVSISCPSVIVGPGHSFAVQTDMPCVVIPCSTDCGEVVIEVAVREQPAETAGAATEAAAQA
ncbi:MAG: chemotaxis protein CheX [Planctomycetota bacterium]